jgi:endonuclease G
MRELRTFASLTAIEGNILDDVRELLAKRAIAMPSDVIPNAHAGLEGVGDSQPSIESIGDAHLEAIVLSIGRPSMLIKDGTYLEPDSQSGEVLRTIRSFDRAKIDRVIASTGRIEFANVPNVPYVGTGWVVERRGDNSATVVTNRHVALEFARADGRGGYHLNTLPNYDEYAVNIDMLEEHGITRNWEIPLVRVLFIAGANDPDIALIEVANETVARVEPITLSSRKVTKDTRLGVVGYPAYDSRSDPEDVARYFGDIFNVKRFAFGNVTGVNPRSQFTHDATTLGGNSGSCVFDRDTGEAVGLHFAGDYRVANYAVTVDQVQAALRGLKTQSVVPSSMPTDAAGNATSPVKSFKGRKGYDPKFLEGKFVKPPQPGTRWSSDLAVAVDADTGRKTKELKYRHFSVWMSRSRKLPLFTAVNIDGNKSKRLGRIDRWFVDERLPVEFQVGNAAYSKNPLDRGHMVRREDPVWGSKAEAKQANQDTFHFTNCAPQHEALNQRDWLNLEDYILGNAKTHGLMVSVFTGPVLRNSDRLYRRLVLLPEAFWKIAAIIDVDKRKLSVTGYLLCQGNLIRDLTTEFVYGQFRTYQVPLALIAEQTGLALLWQVQSWRRLFSHRRQCGHREGGACSIRVMMA